jgi:recombination protein RecT
MPPETVRSAAIKKAGVRAPATTPAGGQLATVVRDAISRQGDAFRAVLPRGVDPDRFARLVLTACKAAPQLMECFETAQGQTSVLLAAMQAAAVGLEPNTPTQEAWLLPRRRQGVVECQLSIGYRGYLKLARRSGTLLTAYAEVVREGDSFEWWRGLQEDHLEHRPADERGELTYAYAVARYVNTGYSFVVLTRADVDARRAMSDSYRNDKSRPYSPWTTNTAAMWRKSAIRALAPFLDLSPEAAGAVGMDETVPTGLHDGAISYEAEWDDDSDGAPHVAALAAGPDEGDTDTTTTTEAAE